MDFYDSRLYDVDFHYENAVCVDTETTGLDADSDEILQLSIVNHEGEPLFNHLIRPTKHSEWPEAENVNHISPEMVKGLNTIEFYRDEINDIFSKADMIIGYNLPFDLAFIRREVPDAVKENAGLYDVMRIFAPVYGEWNDKFRSFKWQKLTTCADYYGYDWGDGHAHDRLEDAKATLFCFNQIYQRKEKRHLPPPGAEVNRQEINDYIKYSGRIYNGRQNADAKEQMIQAGNIAGEEPDSILIQLKNEQKNAQSFEQGKKEINDDRNKLEEAER